MKVFKLERVSRQIYFKSDKWLGGWWEKRIILVRVYLCFLGIRLWSKFEYKKMIIKVKRQHKVFTQSLIIK